MQTRRERWFAADRLLAPTRKNKRHQSNPNRRRADQSSRAAGPRNHVTAALESSARRCPRRGSARTARSGAPSGALREARRCGAPDLGRSLARTLSRRRARRVACNAAARRRARSILMQTTQLRRMSGGGAGGAPVTTHAPGAPMFQGPQLARLGYAPLGVAASAPGVVRQRELTSATQRTVQAQTATQKLAANIAAARTKHSDMQKKMGEAVRASGARGRSGAAARTSVHSRECASRCTRARLAVVAAAAAAEHRTRGSRNCVRSTARSPCSSAAARSRRPKQGFRALSHAQPFRARVLRSDLSESACI